MTKANKPMTKTIEESVYDFANRQFHKAPINTAQDLMCVCSDFANEFLAQPLASRLTAEEKERVRKMYKELSECIEYRTTDVEYLKGKRCQLVIIFGADMFNGI